MESVTSQNQDHLSLQQIEKDDWGEPDFDSYLVRTVHALRRKPVGELTTEDLRIMLGQQVGVAILTPYALDVLERDPLAEGDFYPGDLLKSVVTLPVDHWREHADQAVRLDGVIAAALAIEDFDEYDAPDGTIRTAIEDFRSR
jgi:hypothetical protein